jgi:uncharacterized protein YabE (DUF348 family)
MHDDISKTALARAQTRFSAADRVQVANTDYLKEDSRIPVIFVLAQHIPLS